MRGSFRGKNKQNTDNYCWIQYTDTSARLWSVLTLYIIVLSRLLIKKLRVLFIVVLRKSRLETFESVKIGNMTKHDKHCKLHICYNSCTYCILLIASAKERSKHTAVKKIKIKPVKHASFVKHLCAVHPVESVHNVAQNLPVWVIRRISRKDGPPRVQAPK